MIEFTETTFPFQLIIISVWIFCILYSSPKFFWAETVTVPREENNATETLCVLNRKKYDSKASDIVHFILFYVFPLLVMMVSIEFLPLFVFNSCLRNPSKSRETLRYQYFEWQYNNVRSGIIKIHVKLNKDPCVVNQHSRINENIKKVYIENITVYFTVC